MPEVVCDNGDLVKVTYTTGVTKEERWLVGYIQGSAKYGGVDYMVLKQGSVGTVRLPVKEVKDMRKLADADS